MGMREKQGAGNGDQHWKGKPGAARGDTAGLYAPFEYRQRYNQQREKTMQKYLGVRKSRPETDRTERPSLRIAAEKQKCRKTEKGERPIARPGNFPRLCNESQQSHREDDDACPVMVVLGPCFFGGSVRARADLARNVGFGGERADFEGFFSARRKRLQATLGQTDWLTAVTGETCGRRFPSR